MVRTSASTATRSLFLLALASCAPECAHDRAAFVLPAVKATSTTPLVVHDVPTPIARVDLTIAPSGLVETMRDADLPVSLVDEVDDAFVWRVDLFAHLLAGDAVSVWHRDGELVAASVPLRVLVAPRVDGKPGVMWLVADAPASVARETRPAWCKSRPFPAWASNPVAASVTHRGSLCRRPSGRRVCRRARARSGSRCRDRGRGFRSSARSSFPAGCRVGRARR